MINRFLPVAFTFLIAAAASGQPAQSDFSGPSPATGFAEPLASRIAAISDKAIGAHIAFLASPSMEGRGLGTRGIDNAANYVAATLKLAGIAPYGAKDSYDQLVPIRQLSNVTGQIEIERRDREQVAARTFVSGVDCLFSAQPPQTLKAPIIFAGYGIREPQMRDDYAGLDVRGHTVLILAGVPGDAAWQKPELLSKYASSNPRERFAAKLETAKKLGAAAVLAVEDDGFATRMPESLEREERAFRAYDHEAGHEPPMLVRVSRSVACAVIGEEGLAQAMNGAKIAQPAATATIRVSSDERLIISRNVVGIIPGSDSKLRDEAVILGAHYDHLGLQHGAVMPGADDNASGTAALLELAKTFVASPEKPKRTIVVNFWTGEEEGRFGSDYGVRHPRWPLDRTAAYLNLDMIGHPWLMSEITTLVEESKLVEGKAFLAGVTAETFVEPGLPRGVPALEQALRNSARGNGFTMHLDWTDGKNGGSDYRGYARVGVPFIRFFGNYFPDYHKAGDTAERVDPVQVQRVARFAFAAAWELANR